VHQRPISFAFLRAAIRHPVLVIPKRSEESAFPPLFLIRVYPRSSAAEFLPITAMSGDEVDLGDIPLPSSSQDLKDLAEPSQPVPPWLVFVFGLAICQLL